jgi:hypothetical protein
MKKTLEGVLREERAKHGPQTTLAHFAPWAARVSKGPVTIDLTRPGVRTLFEASLRLWLAGSSPTITDDGHPDGSAEKASLGHVRGLVVIRPEESSAELPAGFYAVASWNETGWAKAQRREIPAVSMGMRINGVDHAGKRWPYRMTHLAVVGEPLFDYGQRRPSDLMANAGSTHTDGVMLDATHHDDAPERGQPPREKMEEALTKIMEMLEALGERLDAMDQRCDAYDAKLAAMEKPEEETADAAAKEKEEGAVDASAASPAPVMARLAELERKLDASMKHAASASAEAAKAKATIARRQAEDVVDAALATRQLDKGARASFVELALRDKAAFSLMAQAAPAREDFTASRAVTDPSEPRTSAPSGEDVFLASMRAASAWQEEQIAQGVVPTPSEYSRKVSEIAATLTAGGR